MDPILVASLGIGTMFLLIILQVPIGIAMSVVGVAGFGILSGFAPAVTILGTESASAIGNVDLAVIQVVRARRRQLSGCCDLTRRTRAGPDATWVDARMPKHPDAAGHAPYGAVLGPAKCVSRKG